MLHRIIHTLISHFIPHEGNDFSPRLLRRGALVMMFCLVTLSFVMANMQALLWQSSDWLVGAILPAVVVDLTNEQRTENAAPQLTRSAVLDAAATLKAEDMAKSSYFSHDSPTGVTPWHWFAVAGYPFVHAGENLAVYFTDSQDVVDAWMKSPGHRANIVNPEYREIGIGTARGKYNGFDTIFVVQLFGTPAIPAPLVVPKVAAPPSAPTTSLTAFAPSRPLAVAPAAPVALAVATTTRSMQSNVTPQVAGESTDELPPRESNITPQPVLSDPATPPATVAAAPAESDIITPVPERELHIAVQDNYQSLYSDLAASSTNLTPAIVAVSDGPAETTSRLAKLAVAPNQLLQLIYILLGALTALALLTSVLLEWRQHRPRETVYGIGLLMLMCGLFYIHTLLTMGVVIG